MHRDSLTALAIKTHNDSEVEVIVEVNFLNSKKSVLNLCGSKEPRVVG